MRDPELVALRVLASDFLVYDEASPDRPINTGQALRRLLALEPGLVRDDPPPFV